MNIVIIGHIAIDHNLTEHASYIAAGGPPVFMTKIFNQLPNCTTTIVTPYGKDFQSYAKNLSLYPEKPISNKTLTYHNLLNRQGRIQKAMNREVAQPISIDETVFKLAKRADIVFFTPLLPNFDADYIKNIVRVTQKEALTVLLPQGFFRQFDNDNMVKARKFTEASQILPRIKVVILSDEDYPLVKKEASKWAKQNDVIIIVTCEENGAVVFSPAKKIAVYTDPVEPKDIVDSVGSGDIFSAAFAYHYKKKGQLVPAAKFANKIARQCLFYTSDKLGTSRITQL